MYGMSTQKSYRFDDDTLERIARLLEQGRGESETDLIKRALKAYEAGGLDRSRQESMLRSFNESLVRQNKELMDQLSNACQPEGVKIV